MIDKIKKLMAMAEHPNSNPNEAANAAAMAAELALRHNIDLSQVRAKPAKEFDRGMLDWGFPSRDDQAVIMLCSAVSKMYGCKILIHSKRSKRWISFVGQKHNIDLCKHWATYLWDSCKQANREHALQERRAEYSEREKARAAFRVHFCREVAVRLGQKLQSMMTQGMPNGGQGTTALVVSAWYEQERKEVEEWMNKNVGETTAFRGRSTAFVESAARAGREAGGKVGLDAQLR